MMTPLMRLTVVFVCVVALVRTAYAWGSEGHQTVALLAQAQLTPKARIEVERLLALEPGSRLSSVSTWADEHRNPATAAWHYVNFPRGTCEYDSERDCPGGKCVVGAIEAQAKVLGYDASDERRLLALKYLVHFVADVHQPLHAGYQDDRGGNSYQLQAFMRGSNLHAVWDTGLIRSLNESPENLASRLLQLPGDTRLVGLREVAEESCRIVGQEGFYPGRLVDTDYIARFKPVVETRLAQAGSRLARILNQILQ